eukprot:15327139-Ditylum_brightwellii.AAC.1
MFNVVIGQCTELMMSKLESETKWTVIEEKHSVVELLQMIKDIAYKYKTQSYPFKVVHNVMQGFYLLYQQEHHILEQYLETFLNNTNVIKHSDGNIGEHPRLAKYIRLVEGDEKTTVAAVVKASLKKSTKAYFAYAFLSGSNQRKYAKMLEDLSNAFLKGKDKYPKTLVAAHKRLASWENVSSQSSRGSNNVIAFATEGYEEQSNEEESEEHSDCKEVTLATKGDEIVRTKKGKKVTCWNYGGNYFSNMCPKVKKKETSKGKKKANGTVN